MAEPVSSVSEVPHLCPAIAEVARIVRRLTPAGAPERLEALRLLREVQDGVHQLRYNQNHWRDRSAQQPGGSK